MAEISVSEKQDGGKTWLWATLAIIAVLALMLWLSMNAEPTQTVVEEEPAEEVAADNLGAAAANLAAYTDSTVTGAGRVADVIGRRAVVFQADAQQVLILLGAGIADADPALVGQEYRVVGRVHAVSDTIAERWVRDGSVREDARATAQGHAAFVRAREFTPADTAAAATGA